MSERVMLDLPNDLVVRARQAAALKCRPLEEVLVEGIERHVREPEIELLPDEQVLALCDSLMDPTQQEQLSDLLARSREERLVSEEQDRLEALMEVYRSGLTRKARAMKTAVARGLRPRLG